MVKSLKFGTKIDMKNPHYEDIRIVTRVELTDDNEVLVFACRSNFFKHNVTNIQKLYNNDSCIYTYGKI
jgi:hypothetical protein